jgi:hypothetical protein
MNCEECRMFGTTRYGKMMVYYDYKWHKEVHHLNKALCMKHFTRFINDFMHASNPLVVRIERIL